MKRIMALILSLSLLVAFTIVSGCQKPEVKKPEAPAEAVSPEQEKAKAEEEKPAEAPAAEKPAEAPTTGESAPK